MAILADRYELVGLAGRGGEADVHLARDRETGATVAVKVPRATDSAAAQRFIEEARLAMRINHPGVLRVLDAGESDGGRPFIVMEHAPGETLRAMLDARGQLPPGEAIPLVLQIAAGLQAIHDVSIVHNDIKPENVLVTADGARITDFGVARDLRRTLTPGDAAELSGTLPYIAPEVVRGDAPSRQADVYALGVVLYEMLTGRLPFAGMTPLYRDTNGTGPAPSPGAFVSGLSPQLEQVVMTALSARPRDRFASATEFSHALQAASDDGPAVAPKRHPEAQRAAAFTPAGLAFVTPSARTPHPRPGTARRPARRVTMGAGAVLGATLLLAAVAGSAWGLRDAGEGDASEVVTEVASPAAVGAASTPSATPEPATPPATAAIPPTAVPPVAVEAADSPRDDIDNGNNGNGNGDANGGNNGRRAHGGGDDDDRDDDDKRGNRGRERGSDGGRDDEDDRGRGDD